MKKGPGVALAPMHRHTCVRSAPEMENTRYMPLGIFLFMAYLTLPYATDYISVRRILCVCACVCVCVRVCVCVCERERERAPVCAYVCCGVGVGV